MHNTLIVIRWLHFSAEMILFGTALFPFYCRMAGSSRIFRQEAPAINSLLCTVLTWASIVGFFSAVLWLALEAGEMGDGAMDALNPGAIMGVLTGTTFGQVWLLHLIVALIILAAVFLPIFERHRYVAVLVSAALQLASQAWVGHAIMEQEASRVIHLTGQTIHLIAGATWIGGLVSLSFVLCKARKNDDSIWSSFAIHALRRFSRIGLISVIMILLSGLVDSWFLVGNIGGLIGTIYGRVLIVKITLFLVMLVIAAINRFALMPRIDPETDHKHKMSALFCTVIAEQGLGLAVLAIVSVLGTLSPAING